MAPQTFSQGPTPRVLQDPVRDSILLAVADQLQGVIQLMSAAVVRVYPGLVQLETGTASVDVDHQRHLQHCLYDGALVALGEKHGPVCVL